MRFYSFVTMFIPLLMAAVVLAQTNSNAIKLKDLGIEPNKESLREFLESIVKAKDDRAEYERHINQLGDASFSVRETATRWLIQANVVHFDLLDKAIQSDDAEIRFRAKSVIDQLRRRPPDKRREDTLQVVLSYVADVEMKQLAGPLLQATSACRGPIVHRKFVEALKATATTEDLPLLRRALDDDSPLTRIASLKTLIHLVGRDANDDAIKMLDDKNESVRLVAAHSVANLGDRRSMTPLARLLKSDSSINRSRAIHILRNLTSQDFCFAPHAKEKERDEAISKWIAWIDTKGKTAELHFPIASFQVDSRGLVAHYTFTNDKRPATDESGNENHGVVHNARRVEAGRVGGGCHFDGRGDFIRVANSDTIEIHDTLTIAIWVKLDSFAPGGYGNEEGHFIKKGDPLWWNPTFGLGYRKGSGRAKFVVGHPGRPASRAGADLYSEKRLKIGKWHHLVGTYDGKVARLFIDGELDVKKDYVGKIRGDRAPLMMGGGKLFSKSEFANHFAITGTIDDVRLYNRALSADEVELLFQEGS